MIRKIFYATVGLLVLVSVAVMGLALARSHSTVQGVSPVAAASPAPHSTHAPPAPKVTTPAPAVSSPVPAAGTPAPAGPGPIVCTNPGTGCTSLVARPSTIGLAADGSVQIVNLVWSSWGGLTATGTGTLVTYKSTGVPNPVIASSPPVTVTESEPVCDGPANSCGDNWWVYTLTTTTAPAPWQSFNINS
jgi:hypothetical protein